MRSLVLSLILSLILVNSALAQAFDTIFGRVKVEEPMLVEIINSEGFQRLKNIDQSGPARYFFKDFPAYSRYEHSLGVYHLLRLYGASFDEQVAGLLHDASHTTFSHVAEHVFKHGSKDASYQDSIHLQALENFGIKHITDRYDFAFAKLDIEKNNYQMLEQKLPDLCADRIEYLLHTAFLLKKINQEQLENFVQDLKFSKNKWYLSTKSSAELIAKLSLDLTQNIYAAADNWSLYDWFAKAVIRAFQIGLISEQEFHSSIDEQILARLSASEDPMIKEYMQKCANNEKTFKQVESGRYDVRITPKFRGVDPWVGSENSLQRLSHQDQHFSQDFTHLRVKLEKGLFLVRN